ncbi:MAG: hypothetical protein Q4D26_06040 [Clostridia bacterium]|nr:hypothetical protein [Clostridia bacterium]
MNKKMYESPSIDVLKFESSDSINLNVSSVQTRYKKTSYKDINVGNVIDF